LARRQSSWLLTFDIANNRSLGIGHEYSRAKQDAIRIKVSQYPMTEAIGDRLGVREITE
jgi:hypothetical protein